MEVETETTRPGTQGVDDGRDRWDPHPHHGPTEDEGGDGPNGGRDTSDTRPYVGDGQMTPEVTPLTTSVDPVPRVTSRGVGTSTWGVGRPTGRRVQLVPVVEVDGATIRVSVGTHRDGLPVEGSGTTPEDDVPR